MVSWYKKERWRVKEGRMRKRRDWGGGMQKDREIKWTTKVEAAMGEGRVWITCVGSM